MIQWMFKICQIPEWLILAVYFLGIGIGWMLNDICSGNKWYNDSFCRRKKRP